MASHCAEGRIINRRIARKSFFEGLLKLGVRITSYNYVKEKLPFPNEALHCFINVRTFCAAAGNAQVGTYFVLQDEVDPAHPPPVPLRTKHAWCGKYPPMLPPVHPPKVCELLF